MLSTSSITFNSLKREIEPVIQSATALNAKVASLTEKMLTEMSAEEITQLQRVAQAHTGTSVIDVASTSIIVSLVAEVKTAKPSIDKLKEAGEFVEKDNYDEAIAVLDTIDDSRFETPVRQMYGQLAMLFRFQGDTEKAAKLEAKAKGLREAVETPAERVEYETGKDLVHAGMGNLRRAVPGSRLPSDGQMDEALEGLHNMSLTSAGRARDASLDEDSIEALEEKLVAAEKKLAAERLNFERALLSGDPSITMPALKQKQQAMQEVLNVKRALHDKGVSQAEEGNPAELLDRTVREGFAGLMGSVHGATGEEVPPECKVS